MEKTNQINTTFKLALSLQYGSYVLSLIKDICRWTCESLCLDCHILLCLPGCVASISTLYFNISTDRYNVQLITGLDLIIDLDQYQIFWEFDINSLVCLFISTTSDIYRVGDTYPFRTPGHAIKWRFVFFFFFCLTFLFCSFGTLYQLT